MASGNTLCVFTALDAELPATNYATIDSRNNHFVLDFDDTTGETAYFTSVLPRHYAGGGITVYVHSTLTSATTGTIGWLIALERLSDATADIDSDSFASNQTITAATVPGTSGVVSSLNVAITNGANMDSIAAGELFRIKVARDVANDTAAGDAELLGIEIKET